MTRTMYKTIAKTLISTTLAALTGLAVFAGTPSRIDMRQGTRARAARTGETHPVSGVIVTDVDPATVLEDPSRIILNPRWNGPFRAHETLNLYIVTILDRRGIGERPFDLVVRFILPDGSTYQKMIKPLDPAALPGDRARRPDLSPYPITLSRPTLVGPLASWLSEDGPAVFNPRRMIFTSVTLPVSGTWITGHNLYGDWQVEVRAVRDGAEIGRQFREFYIGL